MEKKKYQIWSEGYSVTGNSSKANYEGEAEGENFIDAVLNYKHTEDVLGRDGKVIIKKGDGLSLDKNSDGSLRLITGLPCSWACRYFDNEKDARASFG